MATSLTQKILDTSSGVIRLGSVVLMWAGGVLLCSLSLPRAGAPFRAVLLTAVLVAAAVWLHEAGHWLAARLAGMRVLRVWGTFIEIIVQRRGFRWRRSRRSQVWGAVFAILAPDRAMRPAFLLFIACGPAASLLVALISAALAWTFPGSPAVGALLAMALISALMMVISLMPVRGMMPSDGQQLLEWARPRDERSAAFASMRLLSLTVHGTAPDALPADDLAMLESQELPVSLQAFWHRIKAAQYRGDWDAIQALAEAFDAQKATLMPLRDKVSFIDVLRCELAFSEAMRLRDEAPLRACTPSPDLAFLEPVLLPRYAALRAALRGDAAALESALDEVHRHAENDVDATTLLVETRIAAALRERCGLPQAGGLATPVEAAKA